MCLDRLEAPPEAARVWALAEAARRRESTAESTSDRSQYSEPPQVPPLPAGGKFLRAISRLEPLERLQLR